MLGVGLRDLEFPMSGVWNFKPRTSTQSPLPQPFEQVAFIQYIYIYVYISI